MRLSDFLDFTKDKDLSGIMISIEVRIYTNHSHLFTVMILAATITSVDSLGCSVVIF
jgi:hypothetical protein